MTTITTHLNAQTPVTVNALMKLSGLTQTAVTLELVKLGGQVAVLDGGIILAPAPAPAAADPTPSGRGPLIVGQVGRRPKVERMGELAVCRELILDTIRNVGSASTPQLHRDCGYSVDYRNIGRAAAALIADGIITETNRGRTRVWVIADADAAAAAVGEFETLGE